MSATSQPTDFSDLVTDLQNRLRQQTGVTATANIAKRAVNTALHDMHVGYGERFPWAERSAVLITQDDYSTGTVTISQGTTALTGSSTLWNTANAFSVNNTRVGGKVVIDGGVEVYGVSAVGSDTGITLSSAFTQADVAAGSYVYFEDEYALHADFLRPIDVQFFDQNRSINLIGRNEFRRQFIRNKIPGKPSVATIMDMPFSGNTTPVRKVRFAKPPDDFYSIPYSFVTNKLAVSSAGVEQTQLSADADEPIVPLQYRHVIVFHALYNHYRDIRDDDRATAAKGEYIDLMLRITGDTEVGRSRPRVQPRVGSYASAAQRPYSRRGSRYTTGSSFDELR